MTKVEGKKQVNSLIFLFAVTYMVSYLTRINYGTVIAEMERATGFSRSLLSLAVTGSFITYGVGQIISGICGDRFSPKRLMLFGLIMTTVMNFLIPVCSNPYLMAVVWCANGFAQSFMWPPLVRLMSALLSAEDYDRATVRVSWGSSAGTIALYLISPLLISIFSWKAVFIFSGICSIIMIFVWQKKCVDVETVKRGRKSGGSMQGIFTSVIIAIMVAIIMQGALRDGITTWMPSYIAETYNMSSIVAILSGVILPIFSIASFQIAAKLYAKKFKNPVMCAGVIYVFGLGAAIALYFFSGSSPALSVLLSALLTGAMHGVNLLLICMLPRYFEKYGNVSAASGVLNFTTYIGSAGSTYGIALISDKFGWNTTILVWVLLAAIGCAICIFCAKAWERKFL